MIKNKTFRKWYSKINPQKFYDKLWDEIEYEFQEFLKTKPREDEIYSEKFDRDYNLQLCWDEKNIYLSDKIIRKAQRYDIPLPSPRPSTNSEGPVGDWVQSIHYIYYIKDNARYELKLKIREEQKWKHERIINIISILFGFLGLLIALASQL